MTLGKGDKWWHVPSRFARFRIEVREDIQIDNFIANDVSEVMAARHLTDHLQTYFTEEINTMLEQEVKELIIEALQLEDITADDIDVDAALFVEGLELDSIDALELGVFSQKRYGILLSADSEDTRRHFASVRIGCDEIEKIKIK